MKLVERDWSYGLEAWKVDSLDGFEVGDLVYAIPPGNPRPRLGNNRIIAVYPEGPAIMLHTFSAILGMNAEDEILHWDPEAPQAFGYVPAVWP